MSVNYLNKARAFAEVERTESIYTQLDVVTRQMVFFFLLIHSSLYRFISWNLKVYFNLLFTTIRGLRFRVHKRIRENIFFFFLLHWCGDVGVNLPSGLLCHGRLFDFDFFFDSRRRYKHFIYPTTLPSVKRSSRWPYSICHMPWAKGLLSFDWILFTFDLYLIFPKRSLSIISRRRFFRFFFVYLETRIQF